MSGYDDYNAETDGQGMTDDAYTNADLDAAENALVGLGRQGEANAFRQYTQGIRNLVQGEWGQSFMGALERLGDQQAKTIVEALRGDLSALRSEVGAFQGQFQALNGRMDDSEADRRSLHEEIAAFRDEFLRYIAGSKRTEFAQRFADFERRLAALEARS